MNNITCNLMLCLTLLLLYQTNTVEDYRFTTSHDAIKNLKMETNIWRQISSCGDSSTEHKIKK